VKTCFCKRRRNMAPRADAPREHTPDGSHGAAASSTSDRRPASTDTTTDADKDTNKASHKH
jgi:hypothetical protein